MARIQQLISENIDDENKMWILTDDSFDDGMIDREHLGHCVGIAGDKGSGKTYFQKREIRHILQNRNNIVWIYNSDIEEFKEFENMHNFMTCKDKSFNMIMNEFICNRKYECKNLYLYFQCQETDAALYCRTADEVDDDIAKAVNMIRKNPKDNIYLSVDIGIYNHDENPSRYNFKQMDSIMLFHTDNEHLLNELEKTFDWESPKYSMDRNEGYLFFENKKVKVFKLFECENEKKAIDNLYSQIKGRTTFFNGLSLFKGSKVKNSSMELIKWWKET